jgi:type VI secretion system secreted protein VgrG
VSLHAEIDGNEAGSGHAGRFSCRFSAVPVRQQFRPPRRTPKPIMSGPQTAKVIGLDGEEIDTDKYGRIKVHFHWDRPGKKFEKSECWVRVAQVWAGKSFGAMFIPRIGQEVVVDFLEGDPDQPLVTGSVYNGEHMPPWALPEQKTRSGVKSHTHKGNGFNEVSLDDAKGKELINIHAQHDMNTTVLNHDGQSVGGDRTISVSGKHTETIVGDTAITVKKGSLTHDVAEGDAYYHVKGLVDESFDSTLSTTVKKDIQISSTEGFIHVSSDASFVFVSADSSIQMEVGKSRLVMDSQGNITLSGVNVAINGSSSVTIKGAIVTSEAEGANQTKGAVVLSEGTATNTVKGGMVMLNP